MEFALNHNCERIHATDANKQDEYICPLCCKKVVFRKGEVNIDHFAHQSKCDDINPCSSLNMSFVWTNVSVVQIFKRCHSVSYSFQAQIHTTKTHHSPVKSNILITNLLNDYIAVF
jgi:hypothetical protein